jgi:hypothetical protein
LYIWLPSCRINMTSQIEEIIQSKIKPKEKQSRLVEAITNGSISTKEFMDYFINASDVDKGTCADVMKNVSAKNPVILAPYIVTLLEYINYPSPRVKWGVPETIGNLAKRYPDETAKAVPYLLKNTTNDPKNTTVIKWCAAFALTEIAKSNMKTKKELLPLFDVIINNETNNGVKNVYLKAMKSLKVSD